MTFGPDYARRLKRRQGDSVIRGIWTKVRHEGAKEEQ